MRTLKNLGNETQKRVNILFAKLVDEIGDKNRVEINLSAHEKATLMKARNELDPAWSYETPFTWNNLVVNTNWLSLAFGRVIIVTLEHYKTLPPTVND